MILQNGDLPPKYEDINTSVGNGNDNIYVWRYRYEKEIYSEEEKERQRNISSLSVTEKRYELEKAFGIISVILQKKGKKKEKKIYQVLDRDKWNKGERKKEYNI